MIDYAKVVGDPDPLAHPNFRARAMANRAFVYLAENVRVKQVENALLWQQLSDAVKAKEPRWTNEGPFLLADSSIAYQGTGGNTIFFKSTGMIRVAIIPRPLEHGWVPPRGGYVDLLEFVEMLRS